MMNNTKMILTVSERSGVNITDCAKVLQAFEESLTCELKNSKSVSNGFDKVYRVLSFFKGTKSQ